MLSFNINLTSLAIILWSGMLIIAGSIWVLSSQVRKLADLLEQRPAGPSVEVAPLVQVDLVSPAPRLPRRGASSRVRGAVRTASVGSRGPAGLPAVGRTLRVPRGLEAVERGGDGPVG